MRSGFARRAISETHSRRPRCLTHEGALDWSVGADAGAFMSTHSRKQTAQGGWAEGIPLLAILAPAVLRRLAGVPSPLDKTLLIQSLAGCERTGGLLPDAEARENLAQQIVGGVLAQYGVERLLRQPQFFGHQLPAPQLAAGRFNMHAHPVQRTQMPLARKERRLGTVAPARGLEDAPAQCVDAGARLRRYGDAARGRCEIRHQVALVEYV